MGGNFYRAGLVLYCDFGVTNYYTRPLTPLKSPASRILSSLSYNCYINDVKRMAHPKHSSLLNGFLTGQLNSFERYIEDFQTGFSAFSISKLIHQAWTVLNSKKPSNMTNSLNSHNLSMEVCVKWFFWYTQRPLLRNRSSYITKLFINIKLSKNCK